MCLWAGVGGAEREEGTLAPRDQCWKPRPPSPQAGGPCADGHGECGRAGLGRSHPPQPRRASWGRHADLVTPDAEQRAPSRGRPPCRRDPHSGRGCEANGRPMGGPLLPHERTLPQKCPPHSATTRLYATPARRRPLARERAPAGRRAESSSQRLARRPARGLPGLRSEPRDLSK
uniref:Uncharacterized protein n=1 Tax=Rousettus aegyptiacus TaxID=9407 RepID=A0A7J8BEK5_ROUAE|nr:hypothetical protein HJG63_009796 [Rousettus aegyptiacus]